MYWEGIVLESYGVFTLGGPSRCAPKPSGSAPAASLLCRNLPAPPSSAASARPHRPQPILVRCGSPEPYWPSPGTGTGVQHGPYMQHGHRNGPQTMVGRRRPLGTPCCTPQIPEGPVPRPQCSPDGRNLKIHTVRSNRRVIESSKSYFSCRSTPSDPAPSQAEALAGSGSLEVTI